jgi:hypothetical protein
MSPFRLHLICRAAMAMAVLSGGHPAFAKETDQFTTPRAPLRDIGPELSRKVVSIIESDRTGEDPERVLSRWVGHNIFQSRITRWVKTIRPADGPVSFRPSVFGSIYRRTFSPLPASFLIDSPTVRVYGYYLGTDKIDHFFQQGHHYFELVTKDEAKGNDTATAIAAAVALGVKQEHRYYGTLASGVYSNADLAANFAGMKFYLNLQHSVQIGGRVLPPMFERSPEGWRLRSGIDPDRLLEPFFSNHLDESFNPSRYRFSRGSIRSLVRNRCGQWASFHADRLSLIAPAGQSFAAKWFGEDYGHWLPPSQEVSIATECKAATLDFFTAGSSTQVGIVR